MISASSNRDAMFPQIGLFLYYQNVNQIKWHASQSMRGEVVHRGVIVFSVHLSAGYRYISSSYFNEEEKIESNFLKSQWDWSSHLSKPPTTNSTLASISHGHFLPSREMWICPRCTQMDSHAPSFQGNEKSNIREVRNWTVTLACA